MRLLILFALTLTALGAGGCGTVMNVQQVEPKMFGGTRMGASDFSGGHQFGVIIGGPVCIVDKPFSLVGDCVTLPYVLWKRAECRSPRIDPNPPGLREAIASKPAALPAPGFRGRPSDVVGNTVTKATEIAHEQGYSFVVIGSADGVTATIAHAGRRIEARTRDGIVVSAQAFEQ